MMGFLNEDDGDCLFKLASVASRKKSNTVEYQKRERPSAIATHQVGEFHTILEQETHQESELGQKPDIS